MGMCKPSGGFDKRIGRLGSLPIKSDTPNIRLDLYNTKGELIQQRWYGPDCWVVHNRDYNHGYPRPHDHYWTWDDIKGLLRCEDHCDVDNSFC